MDRTSIWSSGGGTQSAAIAALIVKGVLPKPDLAVIVDTESEQSTTWEYMDSVITPNLATVGLVLHRVKKSDFATVDVWGGKNDDSILMPVFTNQSGEAGKLPGYCSNEWKTRVMQRWAVTKGVKQAEVWVGISTDEMQRLQKSKGKWLKRYVLIEQAMNRAQCESLVLSMGWPKPPRSSCWHCPNHTAHEWRDIRDNKHNDWQQAIVFDREIRKRDPNAFLHHDCVPLDKADIDEKNGILFQHCDSGMCFT